MFGGFLPQEWQGLKAEEYLTHYANPILLVATQDQSTFLNKSVSPVKDYRYYDTLNDTAAIYAEISNWLSNNL